MITKSELNSKFVKPTLNNIVLVFGGFLLAPSNIMMSFYQSHEFFRYSAILIGSLVVIFALFRMLEVSLKLIGDYSSKS
jgi:hypothetical protein